MEDHAEILSMDSSVTALRGTLELCVIQVGDSYVRSLRANGIFGNRSSYWVRISSRRSSVLIWSPNLDDRPKIKLSEMLSVLSTNFSACSLLHVRSRVNSVGIV